MEFYETVDKRRTIRRFQDAPVEEAKIRRVLEAGLKAPCNAHLKYWEFILLKDPKRRREAIVEGLRARDLKDKAEVERFIAPLGDEALKEVYRRSLPLQLTMMLEAPELLIVCYKMKRLSEAKSLFELNPLASIWMCIENVMLALAAEGLYGCTYTAYDSDRLKTYLGVPDGYEVASVIPFGYPGEVPVDTKSESVESRIHVDGW
jgi:nitroreductase